MEESKIVTRSIRADEATLEQFKKISEGFPSQAEALKELVNMYELDAARAAIPGSADMIEVLRGNLDSIQKSFIFALELKQNAEERAQESVRAKSEIKDKTIAGLQADKETLTAKIEAQKAENESLRSEVKKAEESAAEAQKTAQNASEALIATKSSLADKNALLVSKNAEIERLSSEASLVPELKKEVEDLRTENATHKTSILNIQRTADEAKKEFERTVSDMKKEAEAARKEAERDIQIAKKEAENDRKAAVIEAKEEAQKKIDAYVAKIEKKDEEISNLKEKIAVLQRENMLLKLSAEDDVDDIEQTELEI